MLNPLNDFADALENFVSSELRNGLQPADYNNEAIKIVDAHNHYFINVGVGITDESNAVYALRDLCRVDEMSMDIVPDRRKIETIARDFGFNFF